MTKLSIDVTVPSLAQTFQLLVPDEMIGGELLEAVEDMIAERFELQRQGDLFFAFGGEKLDYDMPLKKIHRGTRLLLM